MFCSSIFWFYIVLFGISQSCFFNSITINSYYEGIVAYQGTYSVNIATSSTGTTINNGTRIMIIQMQGGIINNDDSSFYGNGVDGRGSIQNDAGYYEFNIVTYSEEISIDEQKLHLELKILHNYNSNNNYVFQVITVPMCSAQVSTIENLQAPPWDGSTGGIIAILAYGDIIINNQISASSKGFRGAEDQDNPTEPDPMEPTEYYSTIFIEDERTGQKGEGYIGYPSLNGVTTNYPGGCEFAAGAPGNAGGGGNSIDGAGGGGGNAGRGGNGGLGLQVVGIEIVDVLAGLGGDATVYSSQRLFLGS